MSTIATQLVRSAEARVTETPNATMTTLGSPTASGTVGLSLWVVEMTTGQQGPPHVFVSEQVWTVLAGEVTIEVDGVAALLSVGDSLTLPGGAVRQVSAVSDVRMMVCGMADATVRVPGEAESHGTPPWIA
jgi:quercetin dioxygenase-like cupin family protein